MRSYWLKSIGSTQDPQAKDWVTSAPQELSEVHFPGKGEPSVSIGDYLVYHTSGTSKIVGIVEVDGPITHDSPEKQWPWRCPVKPHLILGAIDDRAPGLSRRPTSSSQHEVGHAAVAHIQLSEDEYERALAALELVFDSGKGDLLGTWPFFRTTLR